ncbi:helix-turn-helix domain-containing protein [Kaistia sp. MMO-174]|uniref:helix-turn-helix domain-containing protein n=1 Tax=Kaistia sp. MMO-174 TaxID=3081256 RepID=UPI0030167403
MHGDTDRPVLPDFPEIERQRRLLGLTQSELCRKAEINEATYTRLKHGTTAGANARTLRRLADALLAAARQRGAAE